MPDENIDIKETMKNLIDLQKLDSEIFDLESKKDTFPGRLAEMDESLESKKSGMEDAEEDLKSLQVKKNEKETDMQEKEDKIRKHEGDLYQIKNNKEYSALQHEIDSIRADVSLIEEDIINLFDKIEEAQAKCNEEKKIFDEEKSQVEKEKTSIKQEEVALTGRLEELNAKRGEFTSKIAPDILSRYETILKNRGRSALARIEGEFCGECNMQLRPQIINAAQLKKNMVFCESCSRILYVED